MRYVLVRRGTVLMDNDTGLRWHLPAEVLPLLDYGKVDVPVDAPLPPDLIPLRESVERAIEVTRDRWEARRAARMPTRQVQMPLSSKQRRRKR